MAGGNTEKEKKQNKQQGNRWTLDAYRAVRETIIDNAQSTFTGNYLLVRRVFCNLRKAE